eukprot:6486853-Amphidinium_carterae.1
MWTWRYFQTTLTRPQGSPLPVGRLRLTPRRYCQEGGRCDPPADHAVKRHALSEREATMLCQLTTHHSPLSGREKAR